MTQKFTVILKNVEDGNPWTSGELKKVIELMMDSEEVEVITE